MNPSAIHQALSSPKARALGRAALAAILMLAVSAPALAQPTIGAWQRWEISLTSTKSPFYPNPYKDVQVPVELYKSATLPPAGTPPTASGFAFWDGGTTFRIRAKFPPPVAGTCAGSATWWWRTKCAAGSACVGDLGLDNRSGSLTVTCPTGTNPLYAKGPVRVVSPAGDATNRYLVHDNGNVFFWQGDTAWSAGWKSNASQWTSYLANRVTKGFSVIQMSVPIEVLTCPDTQPKNTSNQTPFDATTGAEPCTTVHVVYPSDTKKANPAFWTSFEAKIQEANQSGLLVVLIGLMERTVEKKCTTSRDANGNCMPASAEVTVRAPTLTASQVYARYVAARLAGNHVILSPGFDLTPSGAQITNLEATVGCDPADCPASVVPGNLDRACRTRCIGLEIQSATAGLPGRPLLTNHAGGGCGGQNPCISDRWFETLHKESWTDLTLFQSGQAFSDSSSDANQLQLLTERARERPLNLYNISSPATKPTLNGEGIYATTTSGNYTADKALQVGYLSMLSGAFGYTVGLGGIYDWSAPTTANFNATAAVRMQYLGALFRSLPWQRLQPDHGRILNQPSDPCPFPPPNLCNTTGCACTSQHLMKALASDSIGRFALSYQPAGAATLQFSNSGWASYPSFQFYWFDTRLGCTRTTGAVPSCAGSTCTVSSPDSTKDWVFVMKLSTVGGTGFPFPAACP